jgi:hypothetical protein
MSLNLTLLRIPPNHRTQIPDRDLKREIQRSQHNRKEDPPPTQTRNKHTRPRRNLHPSRHRHLSCTPPRIRPRHGNRLRIRPIRRREQGKRNRERQKDNHETDVCPQRADEINKAENAHEDEEEGERGGEADGGDAVGGDGGGGVGAVGVVEGG